MIAIQRVISVTSLLRLVTSSHAIKEACQEGWSEYKRSGLIRDSLCFKYFSTPVTWYKARFLCRQQSAELASTHNWEDNTFLSSLVPPSIPFWIGLNDVNDEGNFTWSDEPFSTKPYLELWPQGEPDGSTAVEQDCVVNMAGAWYDKPCTKLYTFICKEDIDQCAMGLHDCNKRFCKNLASGYRCYCDQGYREESQNGTEDGKTVTQQNVQICSDVDECHDVSVEDDVCHANATCTNTEGSYMCHCLQGFTGNGEVCSVVCDLPCETGGYCYNQTACQCLDGYTGDLCDTQTCFPACLNGGLCNSTDLTCTCSPGWNGAACDVPTTPMNTAQSAGNNGMENDTSGEARPPAPTSTEVEPTRSHVREETYKIDDGGLTVKILLNADGEERRMPDNENISRHDNDTAPKNRSRLQTVLKTEVKQGSVRRDDNRNNKDSTSFDNTEMIIAIVVPSIVAVTGLLHALVACWRHLQARHEQRDARGAADEEQFLRSSGVVMQNKQRGKPRTEFMKQQQQQQQQQQRHTSHV